MVESINEFFKNFRERLSSPFFFSFIISWVLWNWKITVALIWYNPDLYPKKGDLIEFIINNTNPGSIIVPLIGAFAYTALLKNIISALIAVTARWGGNWNLRISKDSKIPMSKFLTYRDMYIRTNKELEKVIEDERKTIEDFDKQRQISLKLEAEKTALIGEVKQLKADNTTIEAKRSTLAQMVEDLELKIQKREEYIKQNKDLTNVYKDVSGMNGIWKFRYDNSIRDLHFEETLHIVDGVVNSLSETYTKTLLKIETFFYDSINQKLLLVLYFVDEELDRDFDIFETDNNQFRTYVRTNYRPVLIHDLNVKSNDILAGTENVEALITYTRRSQNLS